MVAESVYSMMVSTMITMPCDCTFMLHMSIFLQVRSVRYLTSLVKRV